MQILNKWILQHLVYSKRFLSVIEESANSEFSADRIPYLEEFLKGFYTNGKADPLLKFIMGALEFFGLENIAQRVGTVSEPSVLIRIIDKDTNDISS